MMVSPEVHLLVGSNKSHELWHFRDLNLSGSVNIEMSPGSWEVSLQIGGESSSLQSLVGGEDLTGGSSGGSLVHLEVSVWWSVLVLSLKSVLLDHGSHEDVVGIGGESWGSDSLVSTFTEHVVFTWLEEFSGVINIIVSNLDISIGGGARFGGGVLELNGWLVWWSGVGLGGGVSSELLHEFGIGSVVIEWSKGPGGFSFVFRSRGETDEGSNSKSVFHYLNQTN